MDSPNPNNYLKFQKKKYQNMNNSQTTIKIKIKRNKQIKSTNNGQKKMTEIEEKKKEVVQILLHNKVMTMKKIKEKIALKNIKKTRKPNNNNKTKLKNQKK